MTEIINTTRTEAYAKAAGAHWFRPAYKAQDLPVMLGDDDYQTPMLDDAPWVDPDRPESYDFYGLYPLGIDGIEKSTRSANLTESTLDGGLVGRVRHATRTVLFNGVLVGGSDAAVEYGMLWLKTALLGGPCGGAAIRTACGGGSLCYLSAEPCLGPMSEGPDCDVTACLDPYRRSLHKFTVYEGPTLTRKMDLSDGSAAWTVEFTGTAGMPWEFGAEQPVIEGFMGVGVTDPWAPGVEGGIDDPFGHSTIETDCRPVTWEPYSNPSCLAMVPPPAPVDVPLGCWTKPASWWRRQITIPRQFIPLWGDVVPIIDIRAQSTALESLRLRFYADPYEDGTLDDDPCAYCGDIVFSYVPLNSTLTFNGVEQTIYITSAGGKRQRADSLVFNTEGKPFEWPALTCGFGYVVTFDLPKTQKPPAVDLSLVPRAV